MNFQALNEDQQQPPNEQTDSQLREITKNWGKNEKIVCLGLFRRERREREHMCASECHIVCEFVFNSTDKNSGIHEFQLMQNEFMSLFTN